MHSLPKVGAACEVGRKGLRGDAHVDLGEYVFNLGPHPLHIDYCRDTIFSSDTYGPSCSLNFAAIDEQDPS